VLGLTLWNVAFDGLLSTDVPAGVRLIGFAVIGARRGWRSWGFYPTRDF